MDILANRQNSFHDGFQKGLRSISLTVFYINISPLNLHNGFKRRKILTKALNRKNHSRSCQNTVVHCLPKLVALSAESYRRSESLNGGVAILWFRNNLRIADNSCIDLANTADRVLPLFVFDKRLFVRNHFKQQRCGAFRAYFIKESVEQLRNNLRGLFSDLVVEVGSIAEVLREKCKTFNVNHIVAPQLLSPEEVAYEREVKQVADELGVKVHFVWDNTLIPVEYLLSEEIPDTFEEFYKYIVSKSLPEPFNLAERKRRVQMKPLPVGFEPNFAIPLPHLANDLSVENLCSPHEWPFPEPRAVFHFAGGEDNAEDRLDDYFLKKRGLHHLADLQDLSGAMDSTSKMSAWISSGCISSRRVYWYGVETLKGCPDVNIGYLWLSRFLWRDFLYTLALKSGSSIFRGRVVNEDAQEYIIEDQESRSKLDSVHREALLAWVKGETGYPYIDAHMKELTTAGFISYRGRLNVSSFLVHQLDIDWRYGAEFFEHFLIDHDPVINWGSWYYAWNKNLLTPGGKALDIIEEAHNYDPDGFYVKKWLNQLVHLPPPFCHEPYLLSEDEEEDFELVLGKDYPNPILFPSMAEVIEKAFKSLS